MTPIIKSISPKWLKIIILVLGTLLLFGIVLLSSALKSNRNYQRTVGKLEVLVPQLEGNIKTLADSNKKLIGENEALEIELKETEIERDRFKADNVRLYELIEKQKEAYAEAMKKIEAMTPEETVSSLQEKFGRDEIRRIELGVLFSLKAAKAVNGLWITNQFNLKEKEDWKAAVVNYRDKIVPSLETDLAKTSASLKTATGNLRKVDEVFAQVGIVLSTYDDALIYLRRSFSLSRWKGRGEGVVAGAGLMFFLIKVAKVF